jgi:hypothetical protein
MQNARKTNISRSILIALTLLCAPLLVHTMQARAQGAVNTAFKSGETLQYDLFYNWKFVWVKAGTASMSITTTTYQGKPSYRTRLLTRGTSKADHFFVLRDTLTSLVSAADMLPRYYSKTDMEGEKYRQRNVWYSYKNNLAYARQRYINPHGVVKWQTQSDNEVIFDMLSIMLRARSFDASKFKPGHRIKFVMTDGDGKSDQTLIFRGRKNVKLRNGSATYRCLVLSFVEPKNGKEKEVVTFYVSDDANHIPIRLDLYLNIGTAKAYLVGFKGIRNPTTSRIK